MFPKKNFNLLKKEKMKKNQWHKQTFTSRWRDCQVDWKKLKIRYQVEF